MTGVQKLSGLLVQKVLISQQAETFLPYGQIGLQCCTTPAATFHHRQHRYKNTFMVSMHPHLLKYGLAFHSNHRHPPRRTRKIIHWTTRKSINQTLGTMFVACTAPTANTFNLLATMKTHPFNRLPLQRPSLRPFQLKYPIFVSEKPRRPFRLFHPRPRPPQPHIHHIHHHQPTAPPPLPVPRFERSAGPINTYRAVLSMAWDLRPCVVCPSPLPATICVV